MLTQILNADVYTVATLADLDDCYDEVQDSVVVDLHDNKAYFVLGRSQTGHGILADIPVQLLSQFVENAETGK